VASWPPVHATPCHAMLLRECWGSPIARAAARDSQLTIRSIYHYYVVCVIRVIAHLPTGHLKVRVSPLLAEVRVRRGGGIGV
jgi:hypothetical protein